MINKRGHAMFGGALAAIACRAAQTGKDIKKERSDIADALRRYRFCCILNQSFREFITSPSKVFISNLPHEYIIYVGGFPSLGMETEPGFR